MNDIERLREIDAIEDENERILARLNYDKEPNVRARQLVINVALLPEGTTDEEVAIMSERIKSGLAIPDGWREAVKWI